MSGRHEPVCVHPNRPIAVSEMLITREQYLEVLRKRPDEVRVLADEFLITVTSFFRDPDAFEMLKTKVFPQLLDQKGPNQPIRVWVPACATGEEAYSIAMCLLEFCEDKMRDERVQIFGTDIDDRALVPLSTHSRPSAPRTGTG